jgi:hypothetical protein
MRPLTALSDRNGNRIVFVRDQDGIPTEVQHSGDYRIAFDGHYTAAGFRIEALRLFGGPSVTQRNGIGRVAGRADWRDRPSGCVTGRRRGRIRTC